MNHVMVDLETLGNSAGCVIMSIGAIAFEPGTKSLGEEFYVVIKQESSELFGLRKDESTLTWWAGQSEEAKTILKKSSDSTDSEVWDLRPALSMFTSFLKNNGGKNVKLWGNGADFDNTILDAAYRAIGDEAPWKFWNNRCYRTIKSLAPNTPIQRSGVYHNALDDARSQTLHLFDILNTMPSLNLDARKMRF